MVKIYHKIWERNNILKKSGTDSLSGSSVLANPEACGYSIFHMMQGKGKTDREER
jgi:hypothetical protein